MNYFNEDTLFNPKNLDTDFLQQETDFYRNLYEWYSHQFIMGADDSSRRRAIQAFTISQTLKAVLCLCLDQSNQELFEKILDEMCPIQRTERVTNFEFRG